MYSVGMADFTREEVIQVVLGGRRCEGANLQDIDLSGAHLSWANLSSAILLDVNFREATYDAETRWPEGFDPEA